MKKICTYLLVVALCLSSHMIPADAKEPTNLYARASLLMDAENARVLFEKHGYQQLPMASTTKIMTLIYTLENANLNDEVTISKKAANQPKVRLGVKAGQKYKLGDLVYALMLESYNDCAVAIAEHVEGSVEAFCREMTHKAKDIGAYDTNFKTPSGLDDDEHYTTAYDLALITRYALNNKDFIKITNQKSHQFKEITAGTNHSVNNKNAFLSSYDGAIGVKTGFTNRAGYCFVGAVKKKDRTLISVVFGSGWPPNKSYKWLDTNKLMNYGMNDFSLKPVDLNVTFKPITINRGITKTVTPYIDAEYSLLLGKGESTRLLMIMNDTLDAPIRKNDIIGSMQIYVAEDCIAEVPIKAGNASKKITYKYCFEIIIKKYFNIVQRTC